MYVSMRTFTRFSLTLILALVVFLPATAFAEGSLELGTGQDVVDTTDLGVDIIRSGEVITWTGNGDVEVLDPSGTVVATLSNGQSYTTTQAGEFELDLQSDQTEIGRASCRERVCVGV